MLYKVFVFGNKKNLNQKAALPHESACELVTDDVQESGQRAGGGKTGA